MSPNSEHCSEVFVTTSVFSYFLCICYVFVFICYASVFPLFSRNTFLFPISGGMFAYFVSTVLAFRRLKQKGRDPLKEILHHSGIVCFIAE